MVRQAAPRQRDGALTMHTRLGRACTSGFGAGMTGSDRPITDTARKKIYATDGASDRVFSTAC